MDGPPTPPETHLFSVPEASCNHCRVAIIEEVSGVENVAAVEVDLDKKMVAVSGEADDAAVIAAIREAGYSAESA